MLSDLDPLITKEKMAEIAQAVRTPEELLVFARARRLQDSQKASKPFYLSDSFYKFLGATLGICASVAFLVLTQFLSISQGALTVIRDSYEATEKDLDKTKIDLATATQQLAAAKGELAPAQTRLNQLTEQLSRAETVLEERSAALAEASAELTETQTLLAENSQTLALEMLSGSTLYVCEKPVVHPVFQRASVIAHLKPPPPLKTLKGDFQMSMRIYVLKEGKVAFSAFSKPPGSSFAERRAGDGQWRRVDDQIVVQLISREARIMQYMFRAVDLLDFAVGKTDKICSRYNACFSNTPRCGR